MNKYKLYFKSLSSAFRRKIKEQEATEGNSDLTLKLEVIARNCASVVFTDEQINKIEALIEQNVLCVEGDLINWNHRLLMAQSGKIDFQELWRA